MDRRSFGTSLALTLTLIGGTAVSSSADPQTNKPGSPGYISREKALEIARRPIPGMRHTKTIPTNFPIPQYKSHVTKTNFMHTTKGSPTAAASITTTDQPDTVIKWYQSALRRDKWYLQVPTDKLMGTIGAKNGFAMLNATKDHHQVSVYCYKSADPNQPGTVVNVNWSLKGR